MHAFDEHCVSVLDRSNAWPRSVTSLPVDLLDVFFWASLQSNRERVLFTLEIAMAFDLRVKPVTRAICSLEPASRQRERKP
jgi:hypothetical protein